LYSVAWVGSALANEFMLAARPQETADRHTESVGNQLGKAQDDDHLSLR
jgi:hypothetical protein